VKANIGGKKPTFKFSRPNNITVWSVWEDPSQNVYVAVFSDQAVRKIDAKGNATDVYRSTGQWTPVHGIFDDEGRLWVLETSDQNETRVTLAEPGVAVAEKQSNKVVYIMIAMLLISIAVVYLAFRNFRFNQHQL
jgi:hypothetical protein